MAPVVHHSLHESSEFKEQAPAILIVEDDEALGLALKHRLGRKGYQVILATDASSAAAVLSSRAVDLIVLDVMLPGMHGDDFLVDVRKRGTTIPVLVISALTTQDIRIELLNNGADDFLVKPFDFDELLARIVAILRRTQAVSEVILKADDLVFDCIRRSASRGGRRIDLRPKEADLLELFLRNPNKMLTRSEILKSVWGVSFDPGTNIVDVYVSYLRTSVDKISPRQLIHTVRGKGFMLLDPPPH